MAGHFDSVVSEVRYLVRMKGRLPVIFSRAACVATASERPYRLCALYSRLPSACTAVVPMVRWPSNWPFALLMR